MHRAKRALEEPVFGHHKEWTPAEGKIVASKKHSSRGSASAAVYQMAYVVEYTHDGEAKRVELVQEMSLNGFKMIDPPVGTTVPLLIDKASGKVKFDVDDPRIANPTRRDKVHEQRQADDEAYKRALNGD